MFLKLYRMKERNKKNKKKYLIGILVLILLVVLYVSKQPKKETIVILKEQEKYPDLTQSEQGSIIVDFKAVDEDVNVGGITPTKILLFRSRKVNGLVIYYLYNEKIVEGGIPKLTTSKVELLDGNMHQIAYTFKKNDKQALYVDGKKESEGKYMPEIPITGFAVKEIENEISTDKGNINFNVYDRVLTEKEIKEND